MKCSNNGNYTGDFDDMNHIYSILPVTWLSVHVMNEDIPKQTQAVSITSIVPSCCI